jgi:hypothetical protein
MQNYQLQLISFPQNGQESQTENTSDWSIIMMVINTTVNLYFIGTDELNGLELSTQIKIV